VWEQGAVWVASGRVGVLGVVGLVGVLGVLGVVVLGVGGDQY
jgi:hypothetical protein